MYPLAGFCTISRVLVVNSVALPSAGGQASYVVAFRAGLAGCGVITVAGVAAGTAAGACFHDHAHGVPGFRNAMSVIMKVLDMARV
jgi:hypothetical protein